MLAFFSLLSILLALAGRVLSFNITVNNKNYTTAEIFDLDASLIPSNCQQNVTIANEALGKCGEEEFSCLCSIDTFQHVLDAELCMFLALITENKPMPDPRVGSNPVLSGYSTACSGNGTKLNNTQTALTLPPDWDGPRDIVLSTGGSVIAVMVAGVLGVGSILLLSNM